MTDQAAAGATGAAGAASGTGTTQQSAASSAATNGTGNQQQQQQQQSPSQSGSVTATGAGSGDGSGGGHVQESWSQWIDRYSGGDSAKKNVLSRYVSHDALADAHFALKSRLDSGELRGKLPKDATPEQLAAYRKENGVPEKAEDYFSGVPAETLSEGDKAYLAPFMAALHKGNVPTELAQELLAVRAQSLENLAEARVQADERLKADTIATLRQEWGNDYSRNTSSIHQMLAGAPEEVRDAFLSARTPDGNALVGTPGALRFLATLARQAGIVGPTVMGPSGAPLEGKGIDDRISEITRWMGAPKGTPDYQRYYGDERVQKEYRDLIDARDAQRRRAAA